MGNNEYVCSVKKGHLLSGSSFDKTVPPQCCGKPMIQLNVETQPSAATASQDHSKKKK